MGLTNGGLINVGSKRAQQDTLALSDGLACFTGSFSGVASTSISHGLNSTDLVVEFKDSLGNLLIPDTWSVTNPNVIEVDFSPAATGDVVIIACIESGLAPITGGVTLLESLSGIIDLDSPNGSIDISTSGQIINLNAIFIPASGALLEQKCRDIITLSGLIGGGGLFTPASGALLEQKCRDINTVSGISVSTSGIVEQRIDNRRWHGVISGLGISRNPENSGLFDVKAGSAYVSGIFIEFPGQSGIPANFQDPPPTFFDCADIISQIGLTTSGTINTQIEYFTHKQLAGQLELGFLVEFSPSGTNSGLIESAKSAAYIIQDDDYANMCWHAFAVGPVFGSGAITTDAGSLQLNQTASIIYDKYRNKLNFGSRVPATWAEIFRDSNGAYNRQADSSFVRNTQYDSGFGLVPITGNRYVMHSLLCEVITRELLMVISEDQYPSLQIANDAPVNFACFAGDPNVVPMAKIIIKRNATVLDQPTGDILDTRPIIGGRNVDTGGTVSVITATTLQQAYDNSIDVEIILDNIRNEFNIQDNPTTPLVDSGKTLLHVHASDGILTYLDVHGSGIHIPSGTIEHRLGIVMPRGAQPRCPLDVSGLICSSGLEVTGKRPTVNGSGVLLEGEVDTSISVQCFTESVDTVNFVHTLTHSLGTMDLMVQMYDANPTSGPVATNVIIRWTPEDLDTVRVELDAAASGHFVIFGCPV